MKNLIAIMLVCMALSSVAQQKELPEKEQQKLDKADALLKDLRYEEAIEAYQDVLMFDETNMEVQLKIAETYLIQQKTKDAREWYRKAFKAAEGEVPATLAPYHLYNYAEILLADEQLTEALKWYELYALRYPSDTRSSRKIEGVRNIEALKKDASRYEIKEVSINSKYPDFSPSFYRNGLVFVSGRDEAVAGKGKANASQGTYLDLYYSAFQADGSLTQAEKLSEMINTSFYEGPAVFYNDDSRIIFTRNNLDGKLKSSEERVVIHLQLFSSEKDVEQNAWKKPVLLSINDKDYSIGHPAISSNGRYLYFSSNMPGGYGGTDMYVSEWINEGWGKPRNLGSAINTEGNEMFPFLHRDTVLYFASNGHGGFGGLDIYRFSLKQESVENAGFPINSNKDDFGLILDTLGNAGYFSSNRNAGDAEKNDDIYYVKIGPPPAPVVAVQPDTVMPEIEVYYTVQILALKNPRTVRKTFLRSLKGVLKHDGKDGLHRYTYGKYDSLEEASVVLRDIKAMGYDDAFVRREERYKELSKRPGIAVEKLYKQQ